jgi:hypothetical protein
MRITDPAPMMSGLKPKRNRGLGGSDLFGASFI